MNDEQLIAQARGIIDRGDRRMPPIDLAEIDDVLRRGRAEALPATVMAAVLSTKGSTLWRAGQKSAAITAFQQLIDDYASSTESQLAHEVDFALMSQARLQLADDARHGDGLASFGRLVHRVSLAAHDEYAPHKARMVLDLMPICLALDEQKQVDAGYDAVLLLIGELTDARDLVAEATFLRILSLNARHADMTGETEALHTLGDPALIALDRVSRIDGATRDMQFAAQINRVAILAQSGRHLDTLSALARVIRLAPALVLAELRRRIAGQ